LRDSRHEVRKTDDIKGVDALGGREAGHHRKAHDLGIAIEAVREDGAYQSVKRKTTHLRRDIHDAVSLTAAPTFNESGGRACHSRGEAHHHLSPEQGGKRPPLAMPLVTLDRDQSLAQPY
jgi:hypothetical protein